MFQLFWCSTLWLWGCSLSCEEQRSRRANDETGEQDGNGRRAEWSLTLSEKAKWAMSSKKETTSARFVASRSARSVTSRNSPTHRHLETRLRSTRDAMQTRHLFRVPFSALISSLCFPVQCRSGNFAPLSKNLHVARLRGYLIKLQHFKWFTRKVSETQKMSGARSFLARLMGSVSLDALGPRALAHAPEQPRSNFVLCRDG